MTSPAKSRRAAVDHVFKIVFVPDPERHNVLPALSRLLIDIARREKLTERGTEASDGDGGSAR